MYHFVPPDSPYGPGRPRTRCYKLIEEMKKAGVAAGARAQGNWLYKVQSRAR